MSYVKFTAALAAALSFAVATSAEARHRRCDFDPYGYHAPSRWCARASREGWGFYPAYGFYPAGSYYALPHYPVYAIPVPVAPVYRADYCHYDNGYDFRPRRICVPAW
jgi:hypothetical protein